MKNRSRFLALALAVSVVAANIALPAYDAEAVKAGGDDRSVLKC